MANTLLTPTVITRRSLVSLHQKLRFIGSINRQYDSQFAKAGGKIGSTLQIRLPNEFTVNTGKTLNVQDIGEEKITLTVATQKHVDWSFDSADLALTIDDFASRYIDPAMERLASAIEADALSMYKDVYEEISDDGDTMSNADALAGKKILTNRLAPMDNLNLLLNPTDNESLVNANTAIFNPSGNISSQWREGMVANNFLGYRNVMESSLMPTHTTGTETANTYLTDIAAGEDNGQTTTPASGGSLHVDTGATTFKKGDIIEIETVNDVHQESKVSLGRLKRFVITADYAGGEGDLAIMPGIVASGAKQNVDAAPANDKIIYKRESDATTALGASAAYGISLGYHRDAFTFVTADLPLPAGADRASRQVLEGISMRFWRDSDIINDAFPARIDVLYGWKTIRPEFAVRYGH